MSEVRTTAPRTSWWRFAETFTLLVPACAALSAGMPQLFEARWRGNLAYYGGITLKMTREGYWWNLREGDVWFWNKPPLGYWIHALWVMVFGESAWSLRGPSLVAVMVLAVLTGWMVRAAIGTETRGARLAGVAAGVAVGLNPELIEAIGKFRLDIMHTVCLLLAAGAIVAGSKAQGGAKRWWMIAGLWIGAGLMIKPLFALAVPVVGVVCAVCGNAETRERHGLPPRAMRVAGLASVTGVAIAAVWHVAMTLEHGRAFWDAYLLAQSVDRATGARFEGEPWWWYLARMVWEKNGQLRWGTIATGAATIGGIIVTAALVLRERAAAKRHPGHDDEGQWTTRGVTRAGVCATVWCSAWLVMLSAFADKRDYYFIVMVPGMGALAGVLAWAAACGLFRAGRIVAGRWARSKTPDMLSIASCAACCGLLGAAIVSGVRGHAASVRNEHRSTIERDLRALGTTLRERGISSVYNGGMRYYDAAMLYIISGIWPTTLVEKSPVNRADVSVGQVAVYDVSAPREGQHERPRIDERDEQLLRIGKYAAVRRAADVIGEAADE